MNGQKIGYKRVSSIDQNTARQLDGVPLDKLFEDKASGKDTNRPELQAALSYCREGDTLVVHSMDRLARSLVDLRGLVTELTGRGIAVEFAKENLRFNGDDSPVSVLLLSMLGAVAEFERALILGRQREGIVLAKIGRKVQRKIAVSNDGEGCRVARTRGGRRAQDPNCEGLRHQSRNGLLLPSYGFAKR